MRRYWWKVGMGLLAVLAAPLLIVGLILWSPISLLHYVGAMITGTECENEGAKDG